MKHIVAAVVSAVALAAAAQTTATTYVFTTVDAVKLDGSHVYVTGVQQGDTVATTQAVYCASNTTCPQQLQNCEKLALLAMTKPGQYVLEIEKAYTYDHCALRRVAP